VLRTGIRGDDAVHFLPKPPFPPKRPLLFFRFLFWVSIALSN